jgi:hypothetical protein
MIIDVLVIFTIQFLLMIVGYLISILIGVKSKIESLGLSYLLGSGLITLLFLNNHFFLNISLGSLNLLVSIVSSIICLVILIFSFKKQSHISFFNWKLFKNNFNNLKYVEKLILYFLILVLSYSLFQNYLSPITDWDSLALYDFRAKVIAVEGSMLEGINLGYFFQYPPYTSFLHVFGYIFGAERVKIVYSFIYFSLLTVFYSLLRRNQKSWVALLGTLLLSVDTFIFRHSTIAYSNLSYVTFLSLGIIYLNFWLFSSRKKELFVGSFLVAISTWIRASDPFWYIGLLIIILGTLKNRKEVKQSLLSSLMLLGIYRYWDTFVLSLNSSNLKKISREAKYIEILSQNNIYLNIMELISEAMIYYWKNLSSVIGYLVPLLFFTIYYDFKNKNSLNKYLYMSLATILLIILFGTIIFSLSFETWNQIPGSFQRMSMILIPILIFIIFNSSIWKTNIFEIGKK